METNGKIVIVIYNIMYYSLCSLFVNNCNVIFNGLSEYRIILCFLDITSLILA